MRLILVNEIFRRLQKPYKTLQYFARALLVVDKAKWDAAVKKCTRGGATRRSIAKQPLILGTISGDSPIPCFGCLCGSIISPAACKEKTAPEGGC